MEAKTPDRHCTVENVSRKDNTRKRTHEDSNFSIQGDTRVTEKHGFLHIETKGKDENTGKIRSASLPPSSGRKETNEGYHTRTILMGTATSADGFETEDAEEWKSRRAKSSKSSISANPGYSVNDEPKDKRRPGAEYMRKEGDSSAKGGGNGRDTDENTRARPSVSISRSRSRSKPRNRYRSPKDRKNRPESKECEGTEKAAEDREPGLQRKLNLNVPKISPRRRHDPNPPNPPNKRRDTEKEQAKDESIRRVYRSRSRAKDHDRRNDLGEQKNRARDLGTPFMERLDRSRDDTFAKIDSRTRMIRSGEYEVLGNRNYNRPPPPPAPPPAFNIGFRGQKGGPGNILGHKGFQRRDNFEDFRRQGNRIHGDTGKGTGTGKGKGKGPDGRDRAIRDSFQGTSSSSDWRSNHGRPSYHSRDHEQQDRREEKRRR